MAKSYTLRFTDSSRPVETAQPVQAIVAGTVFVNGTAVVDDKAQAERLLKLEGITEVSESGADDETPAS